ncbi:50S ribosomal protein L21, mitochondrial [Mucuna pruriens]|uniref:Large ribosomal subunit protein bL21m n=1 Tax=Mucuna pruriens TaxID=157652 RepID=A0A371IEJ2_MUCPR|nr:50S ribosomal protein L21, mitochondrial [Mucuna pruriens]
MASRRCLRALTQTTPFLFRNASSLRSLTVPPFSHANSSPPVFNRPASAFAQWPHLRYFSSDKQEDRSDEDDISEEEDEEEEEDYDDDDYVSGSSGKKVYTAEEQEEEAAAIGYRVVGPLAKDDAVFKPYEPVFAVVQIGSHQFKVSNGDSIFTERLKFCEVNDKLILSKVLLVGSASQTVVGRPIVPDAAVHAVVEEHALDAKVIIFKKKRRKNYRRTKGHRQELTKLRITDIQGIEKPQNILAEKPSKPAKKEQEKVAVTA